MNQSLKKVEKILGGTETRAKKNKSTSNNFIRKRTPPKTVEEVEYVLKKSVQFMMTKKREFAKIENFNFAKMSLKEKKQYFFNS